MASPVLSDNSVTVSADGLGGWSAGFSRTHKAAGLFSDVYRFDGVSGQMLVNGTLQTAGGPAQLDIDFIDASINGTPLQFVKTNQGVFFEFGEFGSLPDVLLDGPFVLTINGRAGQGWTRPGAISATYSGAFNFVSTAANAVPEPASLASVALALLAAGAASRRRRRA